MDLDSRIREKIYSEVGSPVRGMWKRLNNYARANMGYYAYSQANDNIYKQCAFTNNVSSIVRRGGVRNFIIIKEKNVKA